MDLLAPLEALSYGGDVRRVVAVALVPRRVPGGEFPGRRSRASSWRWPTRTCCRRAGTRPRSPSSARTAGAGRRSVDIAVDGGRGPLAVPVLAERLALDGAPGHYRCAASLGTAAAPAAGRVAVEVIERPAPFTPRRRAAASASMRRSCAWLAAHGLDVGPDKGSMADVDLVLVGHAGELSEDDWRAVANAADRGATAVVLCPWELIVPGETSAALPLPAPITCTRFHDWLYHKECFARDAGICRWLASAGPHEMAPVRPGPSPSPAGGRGRRRRRLRRRRRVPLPGRVRFRLARRQLPPGARPCRRQYI